MMKHKPQPHLWKPLIIKRIIVVGLFEIICKIRKTREVLEEASITEAFQIILSKCSPAIRVISAL